MEIGFLHPGLMGETLAATCTATSLWASEGRSAATAARAADKGLTDVGTVGELVERASTIVSICPPASAEDVAAQVASFGFAGTYVDANAISPATSRRIADQFDRFVDGSVIGPPADAEGTTRLYLSGDHAGEVAELWQGSVLDARPIDGGIGAASALKMAYASWTKIGGAMLLAIRAMAETEGVSEALMAEWDISQPGLVARSERTAQGVSPKAWRFIGEMEQIASTFAEADLPDGFALAAAGIYERMADLKHVDGAGLPEVLGALTVERPTA